MKLTTRTRPTLALVVVALLIAACHQTFQSGPHGSLATGPGVGTVTGIRFSSSSGYDRIVFDVTGPVPKADIQYVSQVVQDGSGLPLPLHGTAFLHLVLHQAHVAPRVPATVTPQLPLVRQIKKAGDFEAVSSFGIGVSAPHAFRIFTLTSPSRLVVDVQH